MSLTQFVSPGFQGDADSKCSVIVVYSDTAARERALALCDHLVQQFWAEVDFEFSWWRFRYLDDPGLAEAAGQTATEADLVIVSAPAGEDLPARVKEWFQIWLPKGSAREVALVTLTDTPGAADPGMSPLISFAQQAARQAHVDCLLSLGAPAPHARPDPLGALHARATHVSRVLDEILHHVGPPPSPPTHWGLNE